MRFSNSGESGSLSKNFSFSIACMPNLAHIHNNNSNGIRLKNCNNKNGSSEVRNK